MKHKGNKHGNTRRFLDYAYLFINDEVYVSCFGSNLVKTRQLLQLTEAQENLASAARSLQIFNKKDKKQRYHKLAEAVVRASEDFGLRSENLYENSQFRPNFPNMTSIQNVAMPGSDRSGMMMIAHVPGTGLVDVITSKKTKKIALA